MRVSTNIITRFAPSPTGHFHVGAARTALFNFLFAKKHGGVMKLRIEDTDRKRSRDEFKEEIFESLDWLKISYEKPVWYQSKREKDNIYEQYIAQLLKENKAYESEEERKGEKRVVVRFRNPGEKISFKDEVRGVIEVDTTELGDFIIARSCCEPLYHLALVIDDHEMGVTHSIRGEDHIYNTPRQILLFRAFNWQPPEKYIHLPLLLARDRSKLSKRHDTPDSITLVRNLIEQGYLPETVINFLALLGWSPPNKAQNEIFSLDDLVKLFSIDRIQKSGAIFDKEKLRWMNREHIKRLPHNQRVLMLQNSFPKELRKYTKTETFKKIVPVILERIETWGDIQKMHQEGELVYFFEQPEYPAKNLLWKKNQKPSSARRNIDNVYKILSKIDIKNFAEKSTKKALWDYATREGRGEVLWPTRFALSGREKSPDPFQLAEVLGKEETLKRLSIAVSKLKDIE